MSLLTVLEIIGRGIEELRRENEDLKNKLENAESDAHLWNQMYSDMKKERDALKCKLQAVQDYSDSLTLKCENVSKSEEIEERGR